MISYQSLIDCLYCSRSSVISSRQSLIENAPKLDDDVLQKLLSDARQELSILPSSPRSDEDDDEGTHKITYKLYNKIMIGRLNKTNNHCPVWQVTGSAVYSAVV